MNNENNFKFWFFKKATGSDYWTKVYLSNKIPFCLTVIQDDINFIENKDIANYLCPNDCSNQGQCSSGL